MLFFFSMDCKVVPPMNHCEIVEVWNKSEEVADEVQNSKDNANDDSDEILLRRSNLEEAHAVTNPPLEASDPNAAVVMEELQ